MSNTAASTDDVVLPHQEIERLNKMRRPSTRTQQLEEMPYKDTLFTRIMADTVAISTTYSI